MIPIKDDVEWLLLKFTTSTYPYYIRLVRWLLSKIKDGNSMSLVSRLEK